VWRIVVVLPAAEFRRTRTDPRSASADADIGVVVA
jgi:hypothetical protein